ncbi:hypothetical protein C0995_010065 [Termitomyces sp. Mi166|nr:hypothetical protein C0995_010065 [Termitomyces sp. Mi166\
MARLASFPSERLLQNISMATSCSTPAEGPVTLFRYENAENSSQAASVGGKTRICDASSDSMSKIFPSTSSYDYAASAPASLTFSTENANHRHPPRIDLPASLSHSSWSSHPSPDPVSPISFSSPTSSNNPVPRRRSYHEQGYCPSLEFSASPSWETSFNTQFGDFDPLRVEFGPQFIQPEPMLNPSQSQPLNTFNPHNNNDSSTELEVPTIPMLTTLSLPGSLDTTLDVSRCNSPGHRHGQDNSHTQDFSLSSSPPSVSEVTSTADIRVLEFPSPPLTLSPFITAPPPESPIIDLPIADSSTVEYASAVVSSSWGPDISIRPDYPIVNVLSNVSSSSTFETPRYPRVQQESTDKTKPSAILTKFKTLGRKMKKFLSLLPSTKPKGSISNKRPERSRDRLRNAHSSILSNDIGGALVEAGLRGEDSSMTELLSLPPGLSVRPMMITYSRLRVDRPSELSHSKETCAWNVHFELTHIQDERTDDLEPPEDSMRTLEIEARPKTLEEIKSKRRHTLSFLSNAGRLASPSSSIVAVARTRQRPRSVVVLPAASPSSNSGGVTLNDIHVSQTINGTLEDELPVELTWTAIPATSPTQSTSLKRKDTGVGKKHRRFSLPALSHLTRFT